MNETIGWYKHILDYLLTFPCTSRRFKKSIFRSMQGIQYFPHVIFLTSIRLKRKMDLDSSKINGCRWSWDWLWGTRSQVGWISSIRQRVAFLSRIVWSLDGLHNMFSAELQVHGRHNDARLDHATWNMEPTNPDPGSCESNLFSRHLNFGFSQPKRRSKVKKN